MMYVHMPVAMYSLTIKILSNMETKLFFFIPRRSYTIQYINESMKSVDKCKRYSAFYPEKQELPHSLACVYWPVITSPRWRRVGTSQQRSEAVNGASMYICLWPTRSDCQTVSSSVPCRSE